MSLVMSREHISNQTSTLYKITHHASSHTSASASGSASTFTSRWQPRPSPEPTFHPFPDLPIELRLKIWEAALPGACIIPVTVANNDPVRQGRSRGRGRDQVRDDDELDAKYVLRPRDIVLSRVSREAREACRRVYGGEGVLSSPFSRLRFGIGLDFSRDVVYLASSPTARDRSMGEFIAELPEVVRGSLRFLAVDERIYNPVIDEMPPFDCLRALEGLWVVQHDDPCRRDWCGERDGLLLGGSGLVGGGGGVRRGSRESVGGGLDGGGGMMTAKGLQFVSSVVESVEEAMWKWVDACDRGDRPWAFPRLRVVRAEVDGMRCCDAGRDLYEHPDRWISFDDEDL